MGIATVDPLGPQSLNRSREIFGPLELGDVLWYIAAIADELGIPMEETAVKNIEKSDEQRERVFEEGLRCGRVEAI